MEGNDGKDKKDVDGDGDGDKEESMEDRVVENGAKKGGLNPVETEEQNGTVVALRAEIERLREQLKEREARWVKSTTFQFSLFGLWLAGLVFIVQFYLTRM